jgi:hypothetical protein
MSGLQYPSPFFDLGHTYLPATVKKMFRWCRYYYLVNPLINAVISKMAEYPVTDILFDTENKDVKDLWKGFLLEKQRYRSFQIEVGLDYFTYGNALISIFYPFVKYLQCPSCKHQQMAKDTEYRFQNFQFFGICPQCGHHGAYKPIDHYQKAPNGIRLIRWNPENVDIKYNEITGEYAYYYDIPTPIKNDITMGKKATVETIPQLFIDALKLKKAVVFSKDNIYHFKRPTLAGKDRGWGTPMILPVLKDTFYLQILRKAQEAIALEHIVPLRVIFPQAGTATSDPYTSVNLADWKSQVTSEIRRWRSDNNYIPIMPLPLGHQTIGGDGRALLLSQEIRVWSEHIIAGMGIPVELVFGGLSFSGSNVSLRMLENNMLSYLQHHLALLKWTMKNISSYLGWPMAPARFKPFKMADDLQRKAYLFQLNSAQKLSDESLLADSDYDSAKEDAIMDRESSRRAEAVKKSQLLQAELQGEAQSVQAKWQSKIQLQQAKDQMILQNEMAKDQMASQALMQKDTMKDQMNMQQGQPPGPLPPELQPTPRNPGMLEPPRELQSQLTAQTMKKLPPDATGEQIVQQGAGTDMFGMAQQLADQLGNMDPTSKVRALLEVKRKAPALHDVVLGLMAGGSKGRTSSARPLPQQKPPRRGPESSLV